MSGDYYNLLGITKAAESEAIAKAYRKMSLKFHPDLNKETGADTSKEFAQVSEAYEVLSSPKLRAKYDEYGNDGLKGVGEGAQGYVFSGDADAIFKSFFGVANPFECLTSDANKHQFFSESAHAAVPKADAPLERTLYCTLEELSAGCTKEVNINLPDPLTVDIERGLPAGSKLRFAKKVPSSTPGSPMGDCIVTVQLTPHALFKWSKDDLVYTRRISLEDALCGFTNEVSTLDGRTLSVYINEIVHPQYQKVVKGEGMPLYKGRGTTGDLIMKFEIQFPTYLNEGQKKEITRIFSSGGDSK